MIGMGLFYLGLFLAIAMTVYVTAKFHSGFAAIVAIVLLVIAWCVEWKSDNKENENGR